MTDMTSIERLSELEPGDHLCCIYGSEEEHRGVLVPFLSQGLERGEKVLYIADAHTVEEILGYIARSGLDVHRYLQSGQLSILSSDESYMKGGAFDLDGMIRLLEEETGAAISEGYAALRVSGEMSWALRGLPGSERLIDYEAKLNTFFPGSKCLALCQYDRNHFGPDILLDVLTTHPIAMVGEEVYDNFYYIPPEEFSGESPPEATFELRLKTLRKFEAGRRELERSQEKYRLLVESAQEGIWAIDTSARTTFVNRRMAEMLGYTVDEMMGGHLFDFMDDEGRKSAVEKLDRHRSGVAEQHDFEFLRKDGSRIYTSLETAPVLDEGGHYLGAVACVADLTKRREAEQQLELFTDELQQRVKELNCLYSVSRIVEKRDISLPEILSEIVSIMPLSWRYPDIASARITLGDSTFQSEDFRETPWGLSSDIDARGKRVGRVEVYYLENRGGGGDVFLQEEKELLTAVAERLGKIVTRKWAEDDLRRYREKLEDMVDERTGELQELNRRLQQEIMERKRKEENLRVTTERLRDLSARQNYVREEERRRIAIEVHDKLGQELTGLKMNLSLFARKIPEESEFRESLQAMIDLADNIIDTVQKISLELRPGILDDLGLAAAIEWQLSFYKDMMGVETGFSSTLDESLLDQDLRTSLFRISQEALTNVVRHSGAGRVDVRLRAENGELVMEIEDDGIGLTGSDLSDSSSLGILGMKERAYAFGGVVSIQAGESGGTMVRVRMPVPGSGESIGIIET
ncbi:MAG: MEDS domain-containing protein [Actinomycetota bacterium]|nr:MEDS domain-containing protein [Actinomycetota bacterium]